MIPVATEKAGLPDDWSVLGAAVFADIGVNFKAKVRRQKAE
jgi:xylose isomerase